MPIGASKVGALGGLVPGGSVTFNASGTWDVPPGVKIVSITGKGGTGNPGVAGNPGNPGNPGSGGTGGTGGIARKNPVQVGFGTPGSKTWFACRPPGQFTYPGSPPFPLAILQPVPGGPPLKPELGVSGNNGNAGSAGQAGQPGNPGNASSALCNTFPGGGGGNAGVAGAAGNAGNGGVAGAQGNCAIVNQENAPFPTGWVAGNGGGGSGGGGSGGNGNAIPGAFPDNTVSKAYGGGGAGTTNSGGNGPASFSQPQFPFPNCQRIANAALGGTDTNLSAPANPRNPGAWPTCNFPYPCNTFASAGALGAVFSADVNVPTINAMILNHGPFPNNAGCAFSANRPSMFRKTSANFSPSNICQIKANVFRNASGGGSGGRIGSCLPGKGAAMGGGGAGAGRGNAGNAGGNSPTPSGQAATPLTFNCVPVTPGTPTPITVGGPSGGQIVISWNPQ